MNAFPSVMKTEKSRALYLAKAFMLCVFQGKRYNIGHEKEEGGQTHLVLMDRLLEKNHIKPLMSNDIFKGSPLGLHQVFIF